MQSQETSHSGSKDPFENVGVTAAISAVTGGYTGYKAAQAQGLNPLTGGAKASVIAKGTDAFTKDAQIAYDKAIRTQQEPTDMSSTVYRAVSKAELDDITEFGFRTIERGMKQENYLHQHLLR